MITLVVDTDVVSTVFAGRPGYEEDLMIMGGNQCVLSFMTLAELYRWPIARHWGPKREADLREYISKNYTLSLHCDEDLCSIWAEVIERAKASGRTIGVADAWVAATAIYYDAPLLTHNLAHFQYVMGLRFIE